MANLLDKNDRAVRALITAAVAAVNATIPIYIRNDPHTRKVETGLVDVDTTTGNENPKGSGNYDVSVMVRVKFPAATQPADGDNDNHAALAALQEAVVSTLHQSDNHQDYHYTARVISVAGNALAVDASNGADPAQVAAAAANADMVNYSCLALQHDTIAGGRNAREQGDVNFYEVCNFKMNIAGFGGYWN